MEMEYLRDEKKIESTLMCIRMQGGMIKCIVYVKKPNAICTCMIKLHML